MRSASKSVALGIALLLGMACSTSAAARLSESGAAPVHEAALPQQPPASGARPHLRPRPAPDRFFDLVLTKPGANPPPQADAD